MNIPDRIVNKEDGLRAWHARASMSYQLGSKDGIYVWMGSGDERIRVAHEVRKIHPLLTDDYGVRALMAPRSHFVYAEKLDSRYLVDGVDSKRAVHFAYEGCGEKWIGIARAPLPKDWNMPQSRWSGWAHIMHWSRGWPFENFIPDPERVFELILETERDYPPNLRDFTDNIIDRLSIPRWEYYDQSLPHFFPYLDPNLTPE